MIVYRIILSLAAPVVALLYLLRRLRGRITAADLRERLGGGPHTTAPDAPHGPDAPALWLHAASNGELASARPLISALLARDPALRLVITTNSLTGRALAQGWNDPRIAARLAPLDYRPLLRRFLRRHRPAALLLIESDLWLNRIFTLHRAGLPVMVISARMSARSAARWQRIAPRLARQLMTRLGGHKCSIGVHKNGTDIYVRDFPADLDPPLGEQQTTADVYALRPFLGPLLGFLGRMSRRGQRMLIRVRSGSRTP